MQRQADLSAGLVMYRGLLFMVVSGMSGMEFRMWRSASEHVAEDLLRGSSAAAKCMAVDGTERNGVSYMTKIDRV